MYEYRLHSLDMICQLYLAPLCEKVSPNEILQKKRGLDHVLFVLGGSKNQQWWSYQ